MLTQPFIEGRNIRRRATLFILRLQPVPGLLVYYHPDIRHGLYLPGGGVDAGETALDAAYREVFEEAGIARDHIRLIRSLQPLRYYKPSIALNVERHDFVFTTSSALPERWSYTAVSGDEDNGLIHEYQWVTPAEISRVHPEFIERINAAELPELF